MYIQNSIALRSKLKLNSGRHVFNYKDGDKNRKLGSRQAEKITEIALADNVDRNLNSWLDG